MPDVAVERLADEYWAFHRSSAQLWNIDRGDVEQIEHWEDLSRSGVDARVARLREFAARAEELAAVDDDRSRTLTAAVGFSARSTIATLPYARDLTMVAGVMNITTFMTVLVPGYVLTTARDGRGYVDKLRSVPAFVDSWIDGLDEGVAAGRVASARGVARTVAQLDALLRVDPAHDPLVGQTAPRELSDRAALTWRSNVVDAVRSHVRPALVRLRHTLVDDVLPSARPDERPGVCHSPGGAVDYAALLHASTSTDLTAEAIHDIGRRQLAMLDDEYRVLGAAALGNDDPSEVRAFLRDDPSFRYSSSVEVIADAKATLERAERASPRWFGRLPSARCAAVAVEAGPMAYYTGPSPGGERGGTIYFNVADPSLWTRFGLEAAMFHESVPGHHLQLALAEELDLHPVVGELEVVSYGEGWGLYAERLADEMSLYSGPLQRLGMLTLDSLRAARLVVDTGIHALGWSRDAAIEVMLATTSLVRANVEAEVDRYIADPGQATSYMIGRLEIERLRRDATGRLGDRFSLSQFHDTVLGNGMVPLPALERTVARWAERVEGPTPNA